jgi:hypothetical protein
MHISGSNDRNTQLMAIEDIVISFDNGTAAAEAGKTYNNYTGLGSTGVFDSNLSGYDTGGATGVSVSNSHVLTADSSGRLQGANTRAEEVNRQGSYSNAGTGVDSVITATFPATVTAVDVEVFLCTTFSGQVALAVDVNGSNATVDSSGNTTGTTSTFTSVAPDGSDQIVIGMSNPGNSFLFHNGFRFFNIVDSAASGTITPQMMQHLN